MVVDKKKGGHLHSFSEALYAQLTSTFQKEPPPNIQSKTQMSGKSFKQIITEGT